MPDSVGNSPSTAQGISLTPSRRTFSESIDPGDRDYYRFFLANQSSFSLSLIDLTGNANVQLLRDVGASDPVVQQESLNGGSLVEAINTILDPGTYYIQVFADASLTASTNYNLNISAVNNIQPDLLWRNYATGQNALWQMNGTTIQSVTNPQAVPDINWRIQGAADFSNDGRTDILWRNYASGENVVWYMDGANFISTNSIETVPDLSWEIQGSADFNQDGRPDILWRNFATGRNVIWLMNGTAINSVIPIEEVPDLNWQVQGLGDFNSDGFVDLLWRNRASGQNTVWFMNRTDFNSAVSIISDTNLTRQIQGTGDFNGDGQVDILWRDFTNGTNEFWLMNGTTRVSTVALETVPDLNWRAIAPYNRVTSQPVLSDLAGNTPASGFAIGVLNGNGIFRDSAGFTDVDDYYRFSLGSPANVTSLLTGVNGANLTGNLDLQVTQVGGGFSEVALEGGIETISGLLQPGSYYVRVFSDGATGTVPYELSFSVNNLPVLATNRPLLVTEAQAQTITPSFLLVTDENNTASQITYSVTSTPQRGALLLDGAAVIPGSLFSQADVTGGRLSYRQDGSETLTDNFSFTVSDGIGGTIAQTTFAISVVPVNDPPVLSTTNPGLTLSEGATSNLSATNLLVTDVEQTAAQVILTLNTLPTNGSLLLDGITLGANATFSQAAISDGTRLSYRHNGSETTSDRFTFSASDGAGGTLTPAVTTFSIGVTPVNDLPVVITNAGLTVTEGQTATRLTTAFLQATDAELLTPALQNQIVYSIQTAPANGAISLNGLTVTQFTQADINNNRVIYDQTVPDQNSDQFTFIVSDGVAQTTLQTFDIAIGSSNFVPVLTLNAGLIVGEGELAPITSADLGVSDEDNGATELVYTLNLAPTSGSLRRAGTAITVGQTFTQADIDAGTLVSYQHNGLEPPADGDSFGFSVSDGVGGSILNQTFSITIDAINDPPRLLTNNALTLVEGEFRTIATTLLSATDDDNLPNQLLYTITQAPGSGEIQRNGVAVITFTQADLNNNQIRYQHDGSESLADSFVFELQDPTGPALPPRTFNITVQPSNDPPGVSLNTGLNLNENGILNITNAELLLTDLDGPGVLTYTLGTAPTRGQLRLNGTTLSATGTFTQADINANRLSYAHDGSETTLDGFTFTASDGLTNLSSTSVSITIAPVNDLPVLTLPGAQTLNEDSSIAFVNATRINVSDAETGLLTVTLSAGNGTLNLVSGGSGVTGNNTANVTVVGTSAAVSTALSNIVYRPTGEYSGPDAIAIAATDSDGATANGTIDLTVNPLNDPPTLTVPTGIQTVDEDTNLTLAVITTDIDSGISPVLVTLSTATAGGILTLDSLTGLSFISGSNASNSLTFSGTIADVADALDNLTYRGGANYNGADLVTITVNDDGATGGAARSVTQSISVDVVPVNDRPSFTLGTIPPVLEDSGTRTANNFVTNISPGAANESTQALTFNLNNTNPGLFTALGQPSIDPATGTLTFTPATDAFGDAIVTVTLSDDGTGTNTSNPSTFTIRVTPVNDAPSFRRGNNQTVVEDAAPVTVNNWATAITAGPGETDALTFLLSNDNPTLFSAAPAVSATGTLTYTLAPNANGTAVVTVQLRDSGSLANGGVNTSLPQTFTITASAVNDAPILTLPTISQVVDEDGILTITDVSFSDVDAGSATNLQATLTALSGGTLSLAPTSGVTISANNTSTVGLTGSLADLNTALASFNYRSRANFSGTEQIRIRVDDRANTGSGGARTDVETLDISVISQNDAPILTLGGSTTRSINEDIVTSVFTGANTISITDADIGANPIQVTLTAGQGILTLPTTTGLTTVNDNGTSTVTIAGLLASVNTALRSLRYQGNLNYAGADEVLIEVNDLGATGAGGAQTAVNSLSINVVAVNDAPTLTVPPTPITVTEDQVFNFSSGVLTITDVDSGVTPVRATLSVRNGTLNGIGKTITFDAPVDQIQASLDSLIYQGNLNFAGTDVLTIRVNDRGATGTGSPTPPDVVRTLSINVISENDAPTLTTQLLSVNEGNGTPTPTVITNGSLNATDVDVSDTRDQLVYTLQANGAPANGTLRRSGVALGAGDSFTQADIANRLITYVHNGSETTSDGFVFNLSDGEATLDPTTFNIRVVPINDRPTITARFPLVVTENGRADITSSLLQVSDPDNTAAQVRYTLGSNPTNGSLRLNGGNLTSGASFSQDDINNRRVSYQHNGSESSSDSFIFRVNDGAGGSIGSTAFNISITTVNDIPVVVANGPVSLSEGAATTINDSLLLTSDSDNPETDIRYVLTGGTSFGTLQRGGTALAVGGSFTQDDIKRGLITYQNDGSETDRDFFAYQVSDGIAPPVRQVFSINITPVNDLPDFAANTGLEIAGDVAGSITPIETGQLQVTDTDSAPSSLVYTLTSVPDPAVGTLRLGAQTLTSGSTFTQADIDGGQVNFLYLGNGFNEVFEFTVADDTIEGSDLSGAFILSFFYS